MKLRVLIVAPVLGALIACLAPAAAVSAGTAPGSPGGESYFDLARKDCVGTARNTTSKVWFTVADGALSDTYWPTVDATNVHTLQYLVTDGSSFTDLQARHDLPWCPTRRECRARSSPQTRRTATGSRPPTSPIRRTTRC